MEEYQEALVEVYEHEQTEAMEAVLKTLTKREASVLKAKYYQDKFLKTIATELGIGYERIRQIEAHALRKLRHPIRLRMIEHLLPLR